MAGLEVKNKPIFSVQYHPEAGPGPHDSDYLFKKFVSLMLERCWHIVFFWFDNYIWYINSLEVLNHRRFPETNGFFKMKHLCKTKYNSFYFFRPTWCLLIKTI